MLLFSYLCCSLMIVMGSIYCIYFVVIFVICVEAEPSIAKARHSISEPVSEPLV